MTRVGLISDTHGLLRGEAIAALEGCQLIIHAGDIGGPGVLETLSQLAPVRAVRGNNDLGDWAEALPAALVVDVESVLIYVIHDLAQMGPTGPRGGCRVVVSGHSHRPRHEQREGVLFVNPGSAGPRRFRLPVSVGRLVVRNGRARAQLLELPAPARAP